MKEDVAKRKGGGSYEDRGVNIALGRDFFGPSAIEWA